MIKILSEGDGKHRIENENDQRIGWISGQTIGFRGFATKDDAREASVAARRALDRAILAQHTGWPLHALTSERVQTVHDGAYEWFYDGSAPVARLLRPQRRAYDQSFGIELVLPSFANEGLAVTAAHALSRAVEPYRDVTARAESAVRPTAAAGGVPDSSTFY